VLGNGHVSRSPARIDQGERNEKSGCCPDVAASVARQARCMSRFLLQHRHQPHECGAVFAAFKGGKSPLRRRVTLASCLAGGHAIWWTVEAASEPEALALLPQYVAERTTAVHVSEVKIP
jgi:hypothetical protein